MCTKLDPAGSELIVTQENSQICVVEQTVGYLGSLVKPVPVMETTPWDLQRTQTSTLQTEARTPQHSM